MQILSSYKKQTLATINFGKLSGEIKLTFTMLHIILQVLRYYLTTSQVIETYNSDSGRWCIVLCKLDNSFFIICNVYGHNGTSQARTMFTEILSKIKEMQSKNEGAFLIIGGDFNDAPNDRIDRIPSRQAHNL